MMIFRDARHAIRSLKQSPAFAATATLTLAIALALVTTMFAVLDAVVNPYVPYRDPNAVVIVKHRVRPAPGAPTPAEAYRLLERAARSFRGIATISHRITVVHGGRLAGTAVVATASTNLFDVLGIRPHFGRLFRASDSPAEASGAVVSHRLWRRMFAGRTSLDGAVITVDKRSMPIIGVTPPATLYSYWLSDVWIPAATASHVAEAVGGPMFAVGRLRDGITEAIARSELTALAERLNLEHGPGYGFSYQITRPRHDPQRLREFHVAMGLGALVILVIACFNLANLMLARAVARAREIAIRRTLGATRGAVIRQLLMESAILAAAGGALGLVFTAWAIGLTVNHMPPELSFVGILEPQLSWRTFGFGVLAAVTTVLLFGIVPAIRASSIDLSGPLKNGGVVTTARARRFSFSVTAEIILAMSLLVGAGLLYRAAGRVADYDFGFDARSLLSATVFIPRGDASGLTATHAYAEVLERAREIPGARSAAIIGVGAPDANVITSDLPEGGVRQTILGRYRTVSPDALRTLGIPVVAGRDFASGDRSLGHGAAIVDETLARKLWSGSDPIGRMVKLGHHRSGAPWVRVIGVAKTVSLAFPYEPFEEPGGEIYLVPGPASPLTGAIVVRPEGNRAAVTVALSRIIAAVMPPSAQHHVSSWLGEYETKLVARRFIAGLFAFLGVIALLLTAVGLYGIVATSVGQRRREFGIRIALGARPADIVRAIARDVSVMVLAGVGVGAFLAMSSGTLLSYWLWDLHPVDVMSLVAAEVILVGAAVAGCMGPALRGMRADPCDVLRAT